MYKRVIFVLLFGYMLVPVLAHAQFPAWSGFCQLPGQTVTTQGLNSTTRVQATYPKCTVTVYNTGTLFLATLYSTTGGAPLANPFQANTDGSILFFATGACYDIVTSPSTSGGTPVMPSSFTYTGVCLTSPLTAAFSGGLGANYQDITGIPNPGNPAVLTYRLYVDSGTGFLTCLNSAGGNCIPAGSSVSFTNITTGTATVAMHVGTGGTLDTTGSGTITATSATTAGSVPFSGITTGTNAVALHVGTGGSLNATGSGTITATAMPFAGLTTGTNTTGTFTIGTGSSLSVSGSGTIAATSVNNLTIFTGKSLIFNNTLTFNGGDGTTITFPSRSGTVAFTSGALTGQHMAVFDVSGNIVDSGLLVTGFTGTTNVLASTSGAFINGNCVMSDVNHNLVDAGGVCGGGGGAGTVNAGTQYHLGYYATSTTAISDAGADFTITNPAHTLLGGALAILDMHSAATWKPPASAGYAPTAAGVEGFDTTATQPVYGDGAASHRVIGLSGATPTNNFCAKFVVSGTNVLVADAGAVCATGTVNSGTISHLAYYAASTAAVSDMGADFTFSGHTLTVGTAGILVATGAGSIDATTLLTKTWAIPGTIGSGTPNTGAFTTLSATGQITSTLATGTAPLVIASTTNVANLNASSLNGATFASPGAIGGSTPAAGTFTTLTANTSLVINGSNAMTGVSGNSGTIAQSSGAMTASRCLHTDASGNIIVASADCNVGGLSVLDKQDPGGVLTGNSSDQTVYTYSMPGATLASGKCLRVSFFVNKTSGSTSTTYKVFFGATAVVTATTTGNLPSLKAVVCNNAASTTNQWGFPDTVSSIASTPAENTANPITIKGTFNVASPDQVAGKGWIVELLP